MGPIVLFDKSFRQSISLDESVWFSHFFTPIVYPLFYVETLADLAKEPQKGITSEDIVRRIAKKFPDTSGSPCAFHLNMGLANLRNSTIPMRRSIPLTGGKLVKNAGQSGVVYEISPESEAFNRWMRRDFHELERQYARAWRTQLSNIDLTNFTSELQMLGVDTRLCKTHAQAKNLAESIIYGNDKIFERMHLICMLLRLPEQFTYDIIRQWNSLGNMSIRQYAPYAAYVATVELFFHILIASNLESGERASHLIDIGYLNYLPFCDFFVSNDKLHGRCTPLFLRENQQFINGLQLKKGLKELDEYYDQFSIEIKESGISSFAKSPPKESPFFVSQIWDAFFPTWRIKPEADEAKISPKIWDKIIGMAGAPPEQKEEIDFDPQNPDTQTIYRAVHKNGTNFPRTSPLKKNN